MYNILHTKYTNKGDEYLMAWVHYTSNGLYNALFAKYQQGWWVMIALPHSASKGLDFRARERNLSLK